jgi:hypothetical protein
MAGDLHRPGIMLGYVFGIDSLIGHWVDRASRSGPTITQRGEYP